MQQMFRESKRNLTHFHRTMEWIKETDSYQIYYGYATNNKNVALPAVSDGDGGNYAQKYGIYMRQAFTQQLENLLFYIFHPLVVKCTQLHNCHLIYD